MLRIKVLGAAMAAGLAGIGLFPGTTDTAEAAYYGYRGARVAGGAYRGAYRGAFAYRGYRVAPAARAAAWRGYGYRPAGRYYGYGYGYRPYWGPGAAIAAGVVGLAAGAAVAGAYGPYGYGYPAYAYPAYAEPIYANPCGYVWRRAWVAGWGWRSFQRYECAY